MAGRVGVRARVPFVNGKGAPIALSSTHLRSIMYLSPASYRRGSLSVSGLS